jgi:hypothetical protein
LPSVLRRNDQIIVAMLYTEGALRDAALDFNATIFQSMQIHPQARSKHVEIDYNVCRSCCVFLSRVNLFFGLAANRPIDFAT